LQERRTAGEAQLERRETPRLPLRVDVNCNAAGASFSGTTANLTVKGLFVETDAILPLGAEVELHLELPGDGEPLKASGRVVRAAQRASDIPGLAIEFPGLDDSARTRIEELVKETLADYARRAV